MKKIKTRVMVQFSMLLALEALFCFTPLGSLPALGPIVATTAMIPVVITAISMGTGAGSLMGFFAGLFSFIVWTFTPPSPVVAFVFTPFYTLGELSGNFGSLIICFVPRVLVGTVAGLTCKLMERRAPEKKVLRYALAAALGSLANTFGVMGGIWLFFGQAYSSVVGAAMLAIIGTTVLTSGIPEAIVSAIAASAVCKPLQIVTKQSAT